jgi:tetratricopeptide (TPR) repeat protein
MMKKIILCSVVFLITFGVFLSTLCPTITTDDSGELSGAGATLGIAHSPGYPLYSILGRVFTSVIPCGNLSYRMNILSSFFVSLAAVLVYVITLHMTGQAAVGLMTALIFAVLPDVWRMAVTTEVYGVSLFTAALVLFMLLTIKFSSKMLYVLSLIYALGIASHYNLLFLMPALIYWLFVNRYKLKFTDLIFSFLFFLLGLSVFLYLPLRSVAQPLYDWEDPQTLERFWQVVARLRYGSLNLAQGGLPPLAIGRIIGKILFFFKNISQNITVAGLIVGLAGSFKGGIGTGIKKEVRDKLVILWLVVLFAGPGFIIMANVSLDKSAIDLLKRFMHLPMLAWSVIFGFGLARLCKKAQFLVYTVLIVLLYIFFGNYNEISCRRQYVVYDYGKNILRSLPPDAMLFSDRADEMEFALSYLLYAEGQRSDLKFIDCNAGVSRSIYGDDYYRIWGKPRLKVRETVERGIINSLDREVFYATFLPEQVNIVKYPYGLLYSLNSPRKFFPWDELCILRGPEVTDRRTFSLYMSHFQLMGNYYLEYNKVHKAKRYLKTVSAYTGDNDWILRIAYWYYNKGEFYRAKKLYEEALEFDPGWVEVLCNLGVIYEKEGKLAEAIKCYEDAINIKKDYVEGYYNLGVVYWRLNSWEKVIENFEKVLKIDPNRKDVLKFLSRAKTNLSP